MTGTNVIEVMEFDAEEAHVCRRDHLGVSDRAVNAAAAGSAAARAAILALIAAADEAVALLEDIGPQQEQTTALREALANCRGGAN